MKCQYCDGAGQILVAEYDFEGIASGQSIEACAACEGIGELNPEKEIEKYKSENHRLRQQLDEAHFNGPYWCSSPMSPGIWFCISPTNGWHVTRIHSIRNDCIPVGKWYGPIPEPKK